MKTFKHLLIILIFSLGGCEKSDIKKDYNNCIEDHIKSLRNNSICDDPYIDEYKFQDKRVYVVSQGTCGADMTAAVLDQNCNSLGALGGIYGNTTINGDDFCNAEFIKRIWEKIY
ncbi:hypothetical protein OO013_16650 [Mangrovivirga sp. M17]|uniref:DUF6970 domain-containing protein n=1 Tax=Mangrovivirga halotolerans TaxID=2993936 RepID=A0ABT3RVA1_9BACT|nr:hypothetical protein [Mangrovivirga halotolerans]MCX2745512.1 hypothetical protein [Mangrovivirga halotolerans]